MPHEIDVEDVEGKSPLHGHFGGCREFALVEADPEQKRILNTRIVPAPEAPGRSTSPMTVAFAVNERAAAPLR